jgi:hypothetical protein
MPSLRATDTFVDRLTKTGNFSISIIIAKHPIQTVVFLKNITSVKRNRGML